LNEITEKIIGGCYRVANELGAGFLEKVYENALAHDLKKAGLPVEQQKTGPSLLRRRDRRGIPG
jgi:GxxExxY protein